MKKWLKWLLGFAGFFALCWLVQAILIAVNIEAIRSKVEENKGNILEGQLETGEIKANYFYTFPFVSVQINQIRLTDSRVAVHGHELLYTESAYIRINPFKLLNGQPADKIIFKNGAFYSYTDSAGYSNRAALRLKRKPAAENKKATGSKAAIPVLVLKNFVLHFENPHKNNFYDFKVKRLKALLEQDESKKIYIDLVTKARINRLTIPGSIGNYLYHKDINARIGFELEREQELSFSKASINVEGSPLIFDGAFHFDKENPAFNMKIIAKKLDYVTAVSFIPDSIKNKFDPFSFEKPLDFEVNIAGINDFRSKPEVQLEISTVNNKIYSPYGVFSNCSFHFLFHNNYQYGEGDRNSAIHITMLSGKIKGMPVFADTINITGLKDPFLDFSFLQQ